ncbi:TolC family protein [Massilia niastensis]|uniref:TolC family protein n=1 Tax=Massilia niastensis TaxID=544911 RepID=UPI0006848246|nr:TolC family protein [Massilia niastensis]
MRTFHLRSALLGACLALSLPMIAGAAQPSPQHGAPSLRAAVESAWQRSPLVQTQHARQDESSAARENAASWIAAAPTLGLSQRSDRWTDQRGERDTEMSLAASVWLPRQKTARELLASRSIEETEAQLAHARLAIAGEVRARMWEAATASEVLSEKRDHVHHLEALTEEVLRRVKAGDLARSDGLLASQELLAAKNDVFIAQDALDEALARFRVLTGYDDLPPLDPEPVGEPQPRNVRIEAARASLQRAQANLAVATASRHPPPTVALSVRRERDSNFTEPNRSIGVAVQIPLGSQARNRPVETLAATQLAGAAAEAAQAEASVTAEADVARRQLTTAQAALAAATQRAAAMREHTQLLETAFKEGERGLAELLRSQALAHEADISVRQRRAQLGQAHSRLNQALGILP